MPALLRAVLPLLRARGVSPITGTPSRRHRVWEVSEKRFLSPQHSAWWRLPSSCRWGTGPPRALPRGGPGAVAGHAACSSPRPPAVSVVPSLLSRPRLESGWGRCFLPWGHLLEPSFSLLPPHLPLGPPLRVVLVSGDSSSLGFDLRCLVSYFFIPPAPCAYARQVNFHKMSQ